MLMTCTNLGKKYHANSVAISDQGRELFRPPTYMPPYRTWVLKWVMVSSGQSDVGFFVIIVTVCRFASCCFGTDLQPCGSMLHICRVLKFTLCCTYVCSLTLWPFCSHEFADSAKNFGLVNQGHREHEESTAVGRG